MTTEITNQQGGTFEADTFEEVTFHTGTVWRRLEPDENGWARIEVSPDTSMPEAI